MDDYPRHLTASLEASLADNPVTLLVGARQTGKSTLARRLVEKRARFQYLTLDDAVVLAAASSDPTGFVAGVSGPVVIDEIQRVPDLLLAIKAAVDRDRSPGRFLLTGSADVLLLPRVADSLAGRMEVLTLWPLSQGEILRRTEGFVDRVFDREPLPAVSGEARDSLLARVLVGGYPEVVNRSSPARRDRWLGSYVTAVLQRDVRDLSNIERLTDLPRVLGVLAARSAGLLNVADLGRTLGVPQTSVNRYLTLLEQVFLVVRLPAWQRNLGLRLVKAPKLLINDSALMAHVLAVTPSRLAAEPTLLGPLLESFVGLELIKQLGWSEAGVRLHHFRTNAGREVDFVLEDGAGRVVGVEVKAAATVREGDLRGLRALAERLGERFVRGVVLYTGAANVPFSERLTAVPLPALWLLGR